MTIPAYDVVTIGGGIAGATLAKVMSDAGAKVLVIERELQFKDRVRGEGIISWGVAETRVLGVYELIRSCSDELRYWDTWAGDQLDRRDLIATTVQQEPLLSFYHPDLQQTLIHAAERSGAEIRLGATVQGVVPGYPAEVLFEQQGTQTRVSSRLLVGADGRTSATRKYFADCVRRDPPQRVMAGVLVDGVSSLPSDAVRFQFNSELSLVSLILPRSDNRARAYLIYPHETGHRLQGDGSMDRFVEESVRMGVPIDVLVRAKRMGPLASFDGADTWVEHPFKDGLALIGDAAASSDPSFGQGLSLTMRDIRALRDCLLKSQNWEEAGHAYAEAHDRYYRVIHEASDLFAAMFYESGLEADHRRAKALPKIAEDPSRAIDHLFSGPELPLNESAKRRFFGED